MSFTDRVTTIPIARPDGTKLVTTASQEAEAVVERLHVRLEPADAGLRPRPVGKHFDSLNRRESPLADPATRIAFAIVAAVAAAGAATGEFRRGHQVGDPRQARRDHRSGP